MIALYNCKRVNSEVKQTQIYDARLCKAIAWKNFLNRKLTTQLLPVSCLVYILYFYLFDDVSMRKLVYTVKLVLTVYNFYIFI